VVHSADDGLEPQRTELTAAVRASASAAVVAVKVCFCPTSTSMAPEALMLALISPTFGGDASTRRDRRSVGVTSASAVISFTNPLGAKGGGKDGGGGEGGGAGGGDGDGGGEDPDDEGGEGLALTHMRVRRWHRWPLAQSKSITQDGGGGKGIGGTEGGGGEGDGGGGEESGARGTSHSSRRPSPHLPPPHVHGTKHCRAAHEAEVERLYPASHTLSVATREQAATTRLPPAR